MMLSDDEIEKCWLAAEEDEDAPQSDWLLYGQKVAAAAASAERDRCAKACEHFATGLTDGKLSEALHDMAALIRSMGPND
jgi:hypothetical protein